MSISSLFAGMDISATGLRAQRVRMDVVANNIANANTTRTATGGVYQRQRIVMQEAQASSPAAGATGTGSGVQVASIEVDTTPPRMVYDPGHPDADNGGYVAMPNVNIISEMVDMIAASRAYEANATALAAAKDMIRSSLSIGKA